MEDPVNTSFSLPLWRSTQASGDHNTGSRGSRSLAAALVAVVTELLPLLRGLGLLLCWCHSELLQVASGSILLGCSCPAGVTGCS